MTIKRGVSMILANGEGGCSQSSFSKLPKMSNKDKKPSYYRIQIFSINVIQTANFLHISKILTAEKG